MSKWLRTDAASGAAPVAAESDNRGRLLSTREARALTMSDAEPSRPPLCPSSTPRPEWLYWVNVGSALGAMTGAEAGVLAAGYFWLRQEGGGEQGLFLWAAAGAVLGLLAGLVPGALAGAGLRRRTMSVFGLLTWCLLGAVVLGLFPLWQGALGAGSALPPWDLPIPGAYWVAVSMAVLTPLMLRLLAGALGPVMRTRLS